MTEKVKKQIIKKKVMSQLADETNFTNLEDSFEQLKETIKHILLCEKDYKFLTFFKSYN
jgi:hypothetical protein